MSCVYYVCTNYFSVHTIKPAAYGRHLTKIIKVLHLHNFLTFQTRFIDLQTGWNKKKNQMHRYVLSSQRNEENSKSEGSIRAAAQEKNT